MTFNSVSEDNTTFAEGIEKFPNKTFEIEVKVKFVPVIVTTVPACPEVGEMPSTDKALKFWISGEFVKSLYNVLEETLLVINKNTNIKKALNKVKLFIMRGLM